MPFEPVAGQFYRIVAKHSGQIIDIQNAAIHRGTPIQQGTWISQEFQQFQFHQEGQYYNIVSRTTGRSFDVPGDRHDDGLGIVQWDRHDYSLNQQFSFLPAGGGAYYISARHSGKFLCIKEGKKGNAVPLVQHVWNGGDHFQFFFVPCEPIANPRALREIVLRGADPIRDAVLSLTALIPQGGGGVKFLLGLLWSETGGSLIDQTREYVRSVAKEMVDELALQNLSNQIQGLRNVLNQYALGTDGADKGQLMTSLITHLETAQPHFFSATAPEKTLPHLLTLGSMHLTALRERYDTYEKLYGKKPDNPAALLEDLQKRVGLYVTGGQTARKKTLEWRLKYIEFSQKLAYERGVAHHDYFVVEDRFDGWRYVADTGQIDRSRAEGQAMFEERKRQVTESFNAELDVLFGPALAWKYVNPALKEGPNTVRVTTSSEVFGTKQRGKQFTGDDERGPIRRIEIAVSDDGNRVRGLRIRREKRSGFTTQFPEETWGEIRGEVREHYLQDGEVITAAYGNHGGPGDPLYSLYVVTSKGHITGVGRRNIGTAWGSEPTVGSDTQFETFFGYASPGQIEGLGFKWSYVRKE